MSLNDYHEATSLIKNMAHGNQFVKVVSGSRMGTIGRVTEVKSKYFSAHEYRLWVTGRRHFWVKGSELEHLVHWQGSTCYQHCREVPTHRDLMGREIQVGHTILFPRGTEGARVDMIIGTVRRVSPAGAIYVRVFKNALGGEELVNEQIRVGKPMSSMIIDKGTVDQVMLAKLSM